MFLVFLLKHIFIFLSPVSNCLSSQQVSFFMFGRCLFTFMSPLFTYWVPSSYLNKILFFKTIVFLKYPKMIVKRGCLEEFIWPSSTGVDCVLFVILLSFVISKNYFNFYVLAFGKRTLVLKSVIIERCFLSAFRYLYIYLILLAIT